VAEEMDKGETTGAVEATKVEEMTSTSIEAVGETTINEAIIEVATKIIVETEVATKIIVETEVATKIIAKIVADTITTKNVTAIKMVTAVEVDTRMIEVKMVAIKTAEATRMKIIEEEVTLEDDLIPNKTGEETLRHSAKNQAKNSNINSKMTAVVVTDSLKIEVDIRVNKNSLMIILKEIYKRVNLKMISITQNLRTRLTSLKQTEKGKDL
jgi:hypothetical protein